MRNFVIKANNVSDSIENLLFPIDFIFIFIFLIGDSTKSTYQTRLNPIRLRRDSLNAYVGIVGLLTVLRLL